MLLVMCYLNPDKCYVQYKVVTDKKSLPIIFYHSKFIQPTLTAVKELWKETNDLWAATSILALKPTAISVNYTTNSLPI